MAVQITDYVQMVQMNVARSRLAYRQVRAVAQGFGDARLVALVDGGLEASDAVARLAAQRRVQTDARSEDGDDEFDKVADAAMRLLIKALRDTLDWMEDSKHSLRSDLRRLVRTHCPVGPGDIVSQRYEEQLDRTRALVADLRGPYAHLVPIVECERKLREVEATVEPYAEALAARQQITARDVRAAGQAMHERTTVVVAHIIAQYHDAPAQLEALMLPIADQQARIRAILKARRSGQKVTDDPSRDDDDLLIGDEADEGVDGVDGPDDMDPLGGFDDIDAAPAGLDEVEAAPALGDEAVAPPAADPAPRPPMAGNPAVNLPVFTPIGGASEGDG